MVRRVFYSFHYKAIGFTVLYASPRFIVRHVMW